MPDPNLSIMVVDDARFSSALICRVLQQAGYRDIRLAGSAREALEALDLRPANVLLVDWMMPEMDGLQLTARVRQLDESSEHYTYVILLTGSDAKNILGTAFDGGVDDFVSKATVSEQLLPRVLAADRMSATLQRLQREKRQLADSLSNLEQRNVIDPLTGLGNLRLLRQHLGSALRQLEARGGALCYLLVGLEDLGRNHGEGFQRELLYHVARRMQQMLRPLDMVARLDDRHFAAVAMVEDLDECSHASFRRLYEGLNRKALKTSEGFVTLQASIALISVDSRDCPLGLDLLMNQAARLLEEARGSGRIACSRLQRPQALAR
ncbi:response regulator [Pseudomonas stutzeri]|nr:response regulator [Stutzerimonas stutzeri]